MTAPIRLRVDPANPGQFFACCGLLELADRLWPGAEGWFEGNEFRIVGASDSSDFDGERLLRSLAECPLTNTMTDRQIARLEELSQMKSRDREAVPGLDEEKKFLEKLRREEPIVLHEPFRLRIDWFLDDRAGGDRFKTWAGQQSVLDIAATLKRQTSQRPGTDFPCEESLQWATVGDGLPFNFDSDLAGQASAIDLGFSADPLGMSGRIRPVVEFLAFVGLQRSRPREFPRENRFVYVPWTVPLPIAVAPAAACGAIPCSEAATYEFRLLYRTKYLKSFLPARPLTGART